MIVTESVLHNKQHREGKMEKKTEYLQMAKEVEDFFYKRTYQTFSAEAL